MRPRRCCGATVILLALCQLCVGQQIRLEKDAVDPTAGNLACFKIETTAATYFLEKKGAGLSSMLDENGVDWINFHPEKKSGALGEYRGFPNAVYRKDGSFFHPLNMGTSLSTCRVTYEGPDRVTIVAASGNGSWECRWDFYATHCSFTMTKMPLGKKYWVLYEGTPGGQCDEDDWWMTSAIRQKMPLSRPHQGDIPDPEWIAFGDSGQSRVLFLYHTGDDEQPDHFYLMHKSMTVFGFGRQKLGKYLDTVPQTVIIGFLESTKHKEIAKRIDRLFDLNQ